MAISTKNNCFSVLVFNRPANNPFEEYGISSGYAILFYAAGYWNQHPNYLLVSGGNLFTGSYDSNSGILDNILSIGFHPYSL